MEWAACTGRALWLSPLLSTVSQRRGDGKNEVQLGPQTPRSGPPSKGPRSRGAEFEPNGKSETAHLSTPRERRLTMADGRSHPLSPSFRPPGLL